MCHHKRRPLEFKNGKFVIISPPDNFYPDFHSEIQKIISNKEIYRSFSDPEDRIRWRMKQNLDYAYLWDFVEGKSKYFLQLEDDIIGNVEQLKT